MRALAAMGALWAAAWLLVLAGGRVLAPACFAVAFAVFALGECLYDAVQGPLVADLAPAGLTSRYMALTGFSWQLGFMLGPGLGASLLAATPGMFWLLPAVACVVAGGYALRLERLLPEEERTTPA